MKFIPYYILIAAISGLLYYTYSLHSNVASEKERANIAEKQLKDFIVQSEKLALEAQNKIALNKNLADLRLAREVEKYEIINTALKKELYDKNIIINSNDDDITQLQNSLRASIKSRNETASDSITTAEGWRNAYAAIAREYDTLKLASSITTNQYNLCRAWIDEACTIATCGD